MLPEAQAQAPSGRPHGKLEVKVREPRYYAPPYRQGQWSSSRDLPYAYAAAAPPPAGYPYNPSPYGQPAWYGQQPAYGYEQQPAYVASAPVEEKKSKFGLGTGLAVGGLLGGLAIAEGLDYVEDKIAEDAAEKVEDDLAYDNYGGGDDNYGGDDDY